MARGCLVVRGCGRGCGRRCGCAIYSRRTEEAYVGWARRFVRFCEMRHPLEVGERDVERFLTGLAVDGGVSASTQTQALSALVFL